MKFVAAALLLINMTTFAQSIKVRNDIVIAEVSDTVNVEKCIENFHVDWCIIKFHKKLNIVADVKKTTHTIINNVYGCTVRATLNANATVVNVYTTDMNNHKNGRPAVNCLLMFKDKIQGFEISSLFYVKQ